MTADAEQLPSSSAVHLWRWLFRYFANFKLQCPRIALPFTAVYLNALHFTAVRSIAVLIRDGLFSSRQLLSAGSCIVCMAPMQDER